MKILHIMPSPRAEGTPRIVLDWLGEKDLEQELVFLDPNGELKEIFLAQDRWQYYNNEFKLSSRSIFKIIQMIARIGKERKPDILICWNAGFSPWVILGARKAGIRKIITHAGNFAGRANEFNSLVHTNISGWMHFILRAKIICCSDYVKSSYVQMPFSPKSVYASVPNCISLGKFKPNTMSILKIRDFIMVATLERHKDHNTLLEAWKILENQGINYSLSIVGDGSLKEDLIKKKNLLNLDHIEFLGSRKDIPDLLKSSKFFVFSTSPAEGFGTVLLEALASDCEIIASDVPACREVLENGKWGKLVRPRDPKALAEAIIISYSNKLPQKTEGLDSYLQGFTPKAMIQKYLDIIAYKN